MLRGNEKMVDLSVLLLRIGMSFAFLFAGMAKLLNPGLAEMMGVPSSLFALVGTFEVQSGLGVLIGLLTRPSALYQLIILLGAIFVLAQGQVGNPNLPAVWKDPALVGLGLLLLLYGPGKYSLDAKIASRRKSPSNQVGSE